MSISSPMFLSIVPYNQGTSSRLSTSVNKIIPDYYYYYNNKHIWEKLKQNLDMVKKTSHLVPEKDSFCTMKKDLITLWRWLITRVNGANQSLVVIHVLLWENKIRTYKKKGKIKTALTNSPSRYILCNKLHFPHF